ncbi:MAG: arsenate reductase ArsC [Dehalococcoidales bacterium]
MESGKTRVLFLCTHNTARSQMAEAFLNNMAGDRFEAHSAGLQPKDIHPYTREVMQELGIDLSKQYSKALRDYMGKMHFGYLITVCAQAEANCPSTFPDISNRLFWDIENPELTAGSESDKLERFRQVRDEIKKRITSWLFEEAK